MNSKIVKVKNTNSYISSLKSVNYRFNEYQKAVKCISDCIVFGTKYHLPSELLEKILNDVLNFNPPPAEYQKTVYSTVKAVLSDYARHSIKDITHDGYYMYENGDIVIPETGEIIRHEN